MHHPLTSGRAARYFILLTGLTAANAAKAAPPDEVGDNIIVTATRSEQAADRATVPVTVITRQDIEQSLAADLAELLRFEAGIDIGRSGGPGQSTSIFIRGTESNHTLVLIDGVRINPGTVGGAAVQHIAPEMIERIEIVEGPRSALFDSEAIGGVINIITRRNDEANLSASVGGGSFDTRSAFVAAGQRGEDADLGVSLNWQETDGFPPRIESDIDRGYQNLSVNAHAGRRFGSHYVTLRHWQADGNNEYLDFSLNPLDQDFRVASSAVEVRSAFGDDVESKLTLSRINDDVGQNQSADYVESTRNTLDWQLALTGGNHKWIGGLYFVDEDAESFSFGSGFDEDTEVKAVFLEDQWSSGRHRSFLAARLTDHETFGDHATWNAEYGLDLNDEWSLTLGAGHAFRAPDATDRFGFGGNPGLDPEIADEFQAGVRYRPAARHSFGLDLYATDIEDLIEFDLLAFELRNIAEAEIRGAELDWEYRGDGFSLRAAVMKQSAENAGDGSRLLRRAEESLTLTASKELGEHRVGLSVLASGKRADFGGVGLPGYVLANLTARVALGDRWHLNAKIENILDTEYRTAATYRMQARSCFVDVGFDW